MEELKEEGYCFNALGELCNGAGKKYQASSQSHKDRMFRLTSKYITQVLVKKLGMKEVWMSENDRGPIKLPKTPIYITKDAISSQGKLLVIIQGAGDSRVGQWSPSLCLTHSLQEGSMIPFIEKALSEGFEVIVTNPNVEATERCNPGKEYLEIKSAAFRNHVLHVWDIFVANSQAERVYLMAHSYGGVAFCHLLRERTNAIERIAGIAFTDSVHNLANVKLTAEGLQFLQKKAVSWVSSVEPLDDLLDKSDATLGCEVRSAGTTEHSLTSQSATDAIFKQFAQADSGRENLYRVGIGLGVGIGALLAVYAIGHRIRSSS